MKKICFVTGSRADYGIMSPVMRAVAESGKAELQIIATNMHLSPAYGMTVNEIESDGFKVDAKIASLEPGGTPAATVRSMAKAEEGIAEAFERLKPDMVVILGDRYEALAAASAAVVFNIPIAHLHGGETTEGAIDDAFRHAITKLSTYHFAATPQYADKIISMGEIPDNVFHSGAPGAEVKEEEPADIEDEFYKKTGLYPHEPFIILAIHPVTKSPDSGVKELEETLAALGPFLEQGYKILLTMPNSDPGSEIFIRKLEEWAEKHRGQVVSIKSLGSRLFHHAMDRASAMAGNSSAALIEAPSHRLPAVNIGDRQKGRASGITVINVPGERERISTALTAALSLEMKAVMMGMTVGALNPYYKEDSTGFIAEKLISLIFANEN